MAIFEGESKKQKSIKIKYLSMADLDAMWRYINALSAERTFIRMRGEEVSLEDEEQFVRGQIEKMDARRAVVLLLYCGSELAGVSTIELEEKTERHIGSLGISIANAFRGEGLGKVLMQHTIDEAQKQLEGLEKIILCVYASNQPALKLYADFGFVQYGRLPNGLKLEEGWVDNILMYKDV